MENSKGFTLLEIIVVIAMIGIVAAIAVPGMTAWYENYQLKASARDLYNVMQRARSEAVKQNTPVGILFAPVVFPAQGGNVTVFLDDGNGGGVAGNAVQDGTEATLFQQLIPAPCSLTAASFLGNPNTGYNSRGLPLGNRTGSAVLRNTQARWYRMALANSGYPKIQRSDDGVNWQ